MQRFPIARKPSLRSSLSRQSPKRRKSLNRCLIDAATRKRRQAAWQREPRPMKAEPLADQIEPMENDILKILDFGNVLQGITEGEAISREHVPGIYRMVVEIIECANSLRDRHNKLMLATAELRIAV